MSTTAQPTGAVVVGTDGSDAAGVALDWAAGEARRRGTGLHVLYAYPWLARARAWEFAPAVEELELGDRVVAEAAERARSAGIAVTTEVVVDDPAAALTVASATAALVVVGARGVGAVAGPLLGSVSHKVVEHARCPVAVVRAPSPAPDGPVAVGLDPHHDDERTLRHAFEDARRRGVGVLAVQGVQLRAEPGHDDAYVQRLDEAVDVAQGMVRDRMTEWRARYPDVPVELRQVRDHAVDALAEAAGECSVVVVGGRGLGALAGLLLGSVSRGILHRAPVVVVVRGGTDRHG